MENWFVLKFSEKLSIEEILSDYSKFTDKFEVVEKYPIAKVASFNDPLFNATESKSLFDSFFPQAWNIEPGGASNVVIGIIDNGLDWMHPDISIDNLYQNTTGGTNGFGEDADRDGVTLVVNSSGVITFDPGDINGIDDDGNGHIDDFSGWDFVGDDNNLIPNNLNSDHGLNIFGIIGAVANNGEGSVGVANRNKIIHIKAGDDFWIGEYYPAIYYLANEGVKVINMSYFISIPSVAEQDAINYAWGKGCVLVGAGGYTSSNPINTYTYPACYDHVIGTGVLENDASHMRLNSYVSDKIDVLGSRTHMFPGYNSGYNYRGSMHTSGITALTSGLAALLFCHYPIWTNEQVVNQILMTCSNRDDENRAPSNSSNFDFYGLIGNGILNAYKALTFNGTISENTVWAKTLQVFHNVVVNSGTTLTLRPNTVLNFQSDKTFEVYGNLVVQGNLTINKDIQIKSGATLTIDPGAVITFNEGASLIVNGTLIANGISSNRIKFDFVSKNSGIKFRYTGSAGSITYADIKNAYSAVDCYEASPTLLNNSFYNSETGLNCQYHSSPTLAGYYLNGNNIITNNVRGINASYYSNPFVGGTYGGYNSIFGNSLYNISAYYDCSIYAMNNWWGNAIPDASKILQYQSTIDYSYPRPTDPNLGRPLSKVSFAGGSGNSGPEDELITSLYLQMQEKYEEAIASYGKLISKDLKSSKSSFALSKLSECYEKIGRKDFIDFLNKSIRTKSSKDDQISITALELENFWLMKQGRYTEAVKTIGKIKSDYKEKKDTYKHALFNEGYINFVFLNDVAKAREAFKELEEIYPDDPLVAESKIIIGGTPGGGYSAPKNIVSDNSDNNKIPETYALLGNFPNPFNPTTTISYALPKQSQVEVKVYNIMGNEVRSFTINSQSAGYHNLLWDGKNMNNEQVTSGIYIYRLRAVSYEDGKVFENSAKMMLVK